VQGLVHVHVSALGDKHAQSAGGKGGRNTATAATHRTMRKQKVFLVR
jgi:hypothetical protein